MKYFLLILSIFFTVSCCQKPKIVYRYRLPKNPCKNLQRIYGKFYQRSIENTEEENLLVETNNIDIVFRMLENREHIIECYEKVFDDKKDDE